MKSLIAPILGAGLAALLAVGVASAATPSSAAAPTATPVAPVASPAVAPAAGANTVLAQILGLSNAEIMALRQQNMSLAQIAERQKVDPQRLVDALAAQWSSRIDARLAVGAITADQAKTLKDSLAVEAKGMVYQVTPGGMRGAAVGAGPNGAIRGSARQTGGAAGSGAAGAGRGGMMRGSASGTCPALNGAPAS
jgi:hypothetical protein